MAFEECTISDEELENIAKNGLTPDKFTEKMKYYASFGEYGHAESDNIMSALLKFLGYAEGAKVFDGQDKWYE